MSNKRKKISDSSIQAYIDGQMEEAAEQAMQEALRADSAAGQRMEEARLLSQALRQAAPKVPSSQMWDKIHQRLHQVDPQAFPSRPLLQRGWLRLPLVRWGFGAACVAVVVVSLSLQPGAPTRKVSGAGDSQDIAMVPADESPAPAARAESAEAPSERRLASAAPQPKSQPRPTAAPVKKAQPVKVAARTARKGLTDVEKALQQGDLDEITRALRLREQQLAQTPRPTRDFQLVSGPMGGVRMVAADGGMRPAGNSAPVARPSSIPRVDADGFWNWAPAGIFMTQRNWAAAGAEFDLARREAGEAAERSLGASARLSMNRLQSNVDDLGLGDLRRYPGLGLVVLQSGTWQLLVPNRQARFQGSVETRLPGFRSEGPAFIYELSFGRGEFAPGTSFIRMAGEMAARVIDSKGQVVDDNIFAAPRGAEFNFATGELRLK